MKLCCFRNCSYIHSYEIHIFEEINVPNVWNKSKLNCWNPSPFWSSKSEILNVYDVLLFGTELKFLKNHKSTKKNKNLLDHKYLKYLWGVIFLFFFLHFPFTLFDDWDRFQPRTKCKDKSPSPFVKVSLTSTISFQVICFISQPFSLCFTAPSQRKRLCFISQLFSLWWGSKTSLWPWVDPWPISLSASVTSCTPLTASFPLDL